MREIVKGETAESLKSMVSRFHDALHQMTEEFSSFTRFDNARSREL